MAIDEADVSDAQGDSTVEASQSASEPDGSHEPTRGSDVRVGDYTWADFMEEYGYGHEVSTLYPHGRDGPDDQLGLEADDGATVPSGDDWDRVDFDPTVYLGYDPDDLSDLITTTFAPNHNVLEAAFLEYVDPETTPVVKDEYTWEHYKWEYYYEDDGSRPRTSDGEIDRFDEEAALGFDPAEIGRKLHLGGQAAMELDDVIEERTVNVQEDFDEDEFFSTADGHTTVVNRYDLEKAVPFPKKRHFREVERYWVNKPYAFVIIFHSEKENEKKYYLVEPYFNEIETDLQEFLSGKLRTAIKYSEDGIEQKANEDGRRTVIENETRRLLKRYDLFEKTGGKTKQSLLETLQTLLEDDDEEDEDFEEQSSRLEGIEVRPEPILLEEDSDTLTEYQVEKLLYVLKRNFIGYERIDGIKHDINVEDVSVDGYNSPVFVYHSEYEQIITNVFHGEDELDDFVVKLAQRSGKGISKRLPQVDATLPDGSRAQLTLGKEVSDHGTNYTIRQFKDVPFTPIDLINWNTFSLDEMAFLWLCIENHKSLIFAGGTASGKTTSLNAVSLFIPSNTKIVSIEDTREVELPQRNWIASVTRPSFSDDAQGDVDEFDLLEAALRQRPDYIVMGEIRGEEGRTLFQVMSTGHTTYTTFHADSVDEVLKRFTTDPINVSKTMFTALDLVSIQTQTRVQGRKVRRNKSLTEINHYEAEHDEINVQDVYQWQAETDEYLKMGDSNTLSEIQFDRGWSYEKLQDELFKRQIILAYLIKNGLNTYAQVAATVQAFINDPDTILTLIANGQLEDSLEDLREMESVLIDVDPDKEELVPRPDATNETFNLAMDILERAEESMFEEYRGKVPSGLASALGDIDEADPITVDSADPDEFDFGGAVDEGIEDDEWNLGDGTAEFAFESDDEIAGDEPSWLEDDSGFSLDDESDQGTTAEAGTKTADANAGAQSETADSSSSAESSTVPALDERESGPDDTETETDSKAQLPELEEPSSTGDVSEGTDEAQSTAGSSTVEPDETETLDLESEPSAESADAESESTDSGLSDLRDAAAEPDDTGSTTETQTGTESGTGAETSKSSPSRSTDKKASIDDLFGDMTGTLEDLESASASGSATDHDGDDGETDSASTFDRDAAGTSESESDLAADSDLAGFETMFPDQDVESIFSDESSDDGPDVTETWGEGSGSMFGDDSESIFSDDTTDGDGEDGEEHGDEAETEPEPEPESESTSTSDSIFDSTDEQSGSIFDDDDDDSDGDGEDDE